MSDRANFGKDSRKRHRATRDAARALDNYGRSFTGRPARVGGGTVAAIGCLAIVLNVLKLILVGFIVYWNVTDIINVGVNFWNVFWLVVAAILLFGGNGR